MRALTWVSISAALFALGCGMGGQTGGEVRDDDPGGVTGEGDACDETITSLDRDADSVLGFSADDVLAFAEGEHSAEIEWSGGDDFFGVTTNASGTTQLTLQITQGGGEVRYVDATYAPSNGNTLIEIDEDRACPDRVEMDVQVHLETADGALNEVLEATLRAQHEWGAELTVPLDLEALMGSLLVSVDDPDTTELSQFRFESQLGVGLFQGVLRGLIQQTDGQVAAGSGLELFRFGPDACELGETPVAANAELVGLPSLLGVVNDHAPFALIWADGEQTELQLSATSEAEWACFDSTGDRLLVPATIVAQTEDGRIDSELDIDLIAESRSQNGFEQVQLLFNNAFVRGVPIADFESAFGIQGVDLTGHESATIGFGAVYPAGDSAYGNLEVYGLTQADCVNEPPPEPEPGQGGSAPGCAGMMSTVVESATW